VNGKIVPLRHELRNGDTVEIVTSPMGKPSQDWLQYVVTSGARSKIRRHFRLEQMQHSISLGKEMLEREAKRRHLSFERALTREGVRDFGVDSVEKLYAAIGQGDLSALHVIRRLFPDKVDKTEPKGLRRILTLTRKRGGGVRVQGMSNVMIRFAQCCQPVPGEPIIGIVTRGRGISVHRLDCPNTFTPQVEPERRIAVDWDVTHEDSFQVRLFVEGENRKGMLADVCSAITELDVNIISATVGTEGHRGTGRFLVTVRDLAQLRRVMKVVQKVKGVDDIRREDDTPASGRP
jgi:GTP pyrophosphokinase